VALRKLDNASWGFASNCFVCDPGNPGGLKIQFFHDDEADVVLGDYALDETFSGAPSYVHGGITLAILDEAMAWATIAGAGVFALTRTTTTTFLWPVRVGRTHRVEARLASRSEERIEVAARVLDAEGKPCAESRASFVPMSAEHARSAMGTEVTGGDATYLRG
jgi:acyl-coenzyme A thioesterase PaaI-like protein